ncbi:MAG: aspartate ammonia-lyase [Sphaerochaeta sp.]
MRIEHDLIGEMEIPDKNYYGIQTMRALNNFNISGIPFSHYPVFIKAIAQVKRASAQANLELKWLDEGKAKAIIEACDEIISDKLIDQFPVDVIQGGAGTSINMNANEVIANRALELMGRKKGDYSFIHPNNHINLSQSTNDVFPTAIRIAIIEYGHNLKKEMIAFRDSLLRKSEEFEDVIKMGRTQLQDAVPMTLGQEFHAWAVTIDEDIHRLEEANKLMHEINLGGTAIGTCLNTPKGFSRRVTQIISKNTGLKLECASDLIEATQDCGCYVQYSGVLKRIAVKLSKMSNDLRLLSSGPRAGLNEINLPPKQPGSSIMPGKVNPVIPEVMNQVAFSVIGNDVTITMAAEAGQLELNAMEPIIAFKMFSSIKHMKNAINTLRINCIDGITANKERCRSLVTNSIGIITVLNPVLGYENCSKIACRALKTGESIKDIVLDLKLLSKKKLDTLLVLENMTNHK